MIILHFRISREFYRFTFVVFSRHVRILAKSIGSCFRAQVNQAMCLRKEATAGMWIFFVYYPYFLGINASFMVILTNNSWVRIKRNYWCIQITCLLIYHQNILGQMMVYFSRIFKFSLKPRDFQVLNLVRYCNCPKLLKMWWFCFLPKINNFLVNS